MIIFLKRSLFMKSNIFHAIAVTHPAYLTVNCNKELETVGLAAGWILCVTYFENCFDWDLPLIPLFLFNSTGKDLFSNIWSLQTVICVQIQMRKELKGIYLNTWFHLRVINTSNAVSMASIERNVACLSLPWWNCYSGRLYVNNDIFFF